MFPRVLILTFLAHFVHFMWHPKGMVRFYAARIYKALPRFCFWEHNCRSWRHAALFV